MDKQRYDGKLTVLRDKERLGEVGLHKQIKNMVAFIQACQQKKDLQKEMNSSVFKGHGETNIRFGMPNIHIPQTCICSCLKVKKELRSLPCL